MLVSKSVRENISNRRPKPKVTNKRHMHDAASLNPADMLFESCVYRLFRWRRGNSRQSRVVLEFAMNYHRVGRCHCQQLFPKFRTLTLEELARTSAKNVLGTSCVLGIVHHSTLPAARQPASKLWYLTASANPLKMPNIYSRCIVSLLLYIVKKMRVEPHCCKL